MPGYQRLTIGRGATWQTTLEVRDDAGALVVLAGATALMQVRATTPTVNPPLEVLSTTNGRIAVVDPGTLLLRLTAAETLALAWSYGVYDVLLTQGATVTALLGGEIFVDPLVTRA